MRITFQSLLITIAMLLSTGFATAIHAEEEAKQEEPSTIAQWQQKIIDAYKALDHYKVHKVINITQTVDGVDQLDQVEMDIAVDRTNKHIMVSSDRLRMVGKDQIMRTQLLPATDSHLHMDNVDPLDPTVIQKAWPMFPVWLWVPDLSLYLGTEVQLFLKHENFKFSTRGPNLPDTQIEFETQLGDVKMFLVVNKNTALIHKVQLQTSNPGPDGKMVKTRMDFDLQFTQPQTWDEKTFAVDTANSKPIATIRQMIDNAQSPKSLQGNDAPAVVLNTLKDGKTVDIAKLKNKVIVLDFWATWCGPCRRAMPELMAFEKWARDNKHDVAVFAVNIEEEKTLVQEFVTKQNITLPILMDTDGKVTAAYRAYSIPQTVFIADGKIVRIFQGFSPQVADEWRNVVKEALGVQGQ
jgi:thiol-disulfide isomerase/thioredoxin